MSKKQEKRDYASKTDAIQKGEEKILRIKFGDFIAVSVYDLATWVGIGLSIGFLLIYGFQGNQRGVKWSVVSLIFFIVIMLAVRAWQHRSPLADPTKRPELYISEARMAPLVAGRPETIILGVSNRGNAPARNIRLGAGNHFYASSSFEGPLEYLPIAIDTQPDLGPGEEKSIVSHSFEPLSEERIKDFQEGRLLFFHYAEGEYDDDNGTAYPIDFCFMYMPLTPTAMRICPEKYWPKERKDRRFPGRPELVIEQVTIEPLEAGKSETVSLIIRNCGKSTAHNVAIETTHAHKPATFQGPLVYQTLPSDTHPDMPPNGVMTLISRSPWVTEFGHIPSIAVKSRLLFVYGKGGYCDDFGRNYDFKFCYMFEPAFPRNMVIAPDRYWPKDESKNDGAQNPN